jgi:hypothetical protein
MRHDGNYPFLSVQNHVNKGVRLAVGIRLVFHPWVEDIIHPKIDIAFSKLAGQVRLVRKRIHFFYQLLYTSE